MQITPNNWTHCSYTNGQLKAVITFGASPDILDDSFIYYVTVMDDNNNEVFQTEFSALEHACEYINAKYGDIWQSADALKPKKEGGCSTCVAH